MFERKRMNNIYSPNHKFDLEDRTFEFARNIRVLVKKLPKSIANIEDAKQLVRSSGSVGANYIEANEALSKKDFIHRLKICRKEIKESCYWLKLVNETNNLTDDHKVIELLREAMELKHIFSAILQKQ